MIRRQMENYLRSLNFLCIPSAVPSISVFAKVESGFLNSLILVNYEKDLYIHPDEIEEWKKTVRAFIFDQTKKETHLLIVVLAEDVEKSRQLVKQERFAWIIDKYEKRLLIDEDKTPDFYGMKAVLLNFLEHYVAEPDMNDEVLSEDATNTRIKRALVYIKDMPRATTLLVLVNIIGFVISSFLGEPVYDWGEVGLKYIEDGEYYRLISAIFLHAGVDHLFGNMILLYFLGDMVERVIGSKSIFAVFLISGILGNVISCIYEAVSGVSYVTVGASGAVFGIIGALLYLVIRRERAIHISFIQITLMIAYSIYSSFVGDNINTAAHIGGLITGFFASLICAGIRKVCKKA